MRGRGLTLLEVVVSFAVLLTVSVFIFQLVPSSVLAIRQGEIRLEANNLARTLLEQHRALGFSELKGRVNQVIYAENHPSPSGVTYTSEVRVRPVPSSDQARLLELRVSIDWRYRDTTYNVKTGAYLWNAPP